MSSLDRKRARDSIAGVQETCKRIPYEIWFDSEKGHTYALNAAFLCVQVAIDFAMQGLYIDRGDKFSTQEDLCDGEMDLSPEFDPKLRSIDDVKDDAQVQRAFEQSMRVFLDGLKKVWHSKAPTGERMFDLFETVVKHCVTLPVGYTVVHQTGFTSWFTGSFDDKWKSEYGIWTTPLFTIRDATERKAVDATINTLEKANYVIIAQRCIPGFVDIDAFEPPGGRRHAEDRTGFREFANVMKNLCSGISDEDLFEGEEAINDENCRVVMETVTSRSAGLGRDKLLPRLLDNGFMGWVLKYDKQSSLERQVNIFPSSRKHMDYHKTTEDPAARIDVRLRSIELHLIEPAIYLPEKYDVNDRYSETVCKTFVLSDGFFGADALEEIWTLRNCMAALRKLSSMNILIRRDVNTAVAKILLHTNNKRNYKHVFARFNGASLIYTNSSEISQVKLMKLLLKPNLGQYRLNPSANQSELLFKAISLGYSKEMVKLLLDPSLGENRARPSDANSRALQELIQTRHHDAVELVKILLDPGLAEHRARPSDNHSKALYSAIQRDMTTVARMLLDPNLGEYRARPSDNNSAALVAAAQQNNIEMVELLIDPMFGDYRAHPSDDHNALQYAVINNNIDMVKVLIDPDLGMHRARPSDNESEALMSAVVAANLYIVKLLLDDSLGESRARPSDRNSHALNVAVRKRSAVLVKLLLDPRFGEHAARPSDSMSLSLKSAVIDINDAEIAKLLLDPRLGDYRARPSDMNRLLIYAVENKNLEMVKLLLDPSLGEYRARPSEDDSEALSVFEYSDDVVEMVKMLLDPSLGKYRARPSDRDSDALNTAIDILKRTYRMPSAIMKDAAIAIAKMFLDPTLGDSMARPSDDPNILLEAVKANDIEMVKLLLDPSLGEFRARPSDNNSMALRDPLGLTPNIEIVRMLLDPSLGKYRARPSDAKSEALSSVILNNGLDEEQTIKLVKMLLDPSLGEFRACPSDSRSKSLLYACMYGDINVAKMLLDPSLGDCRARPSDHGSEPLMNAVERGQIEMVKLLIDPELGKYRALPSENKNILYKAFKRENIEMIKLLTDPSLGEYRAVLTDSQKSDLARNISNIDVLNMLNEDDRARIVDAASL